MKCKNCGEEYNLDMFDVCPYCLTKNEDSKEEQHVSSESFCALELSKDTVFAEEHADSMAIDLAEKDNQENAMNSSSDIDVKKVADELKISDIEELSVRSKNALQRSGIMTLSELKEYVETQDLYDIRNLGQRSIDEILNVITIYDDLKLRAIAKDDIIRSNINTNAADEMFIETISGLSVRSINALTAVGIETLGQLKQYAETSELSDIRNLGKGSINEIEKVLSLFYPERKSASIVVDVTLTDDAKATAESIRIEDVDALGVRSKNALLRTGLITVMQLIDYVNEYDLSSIRNLGERSIAEINGFLASFCMNAGDENSINLCNRVEEKKKSMLLDINEDLIDMNISLLESLGISSRVVAQLQEAGYLKINDLHGIQEKKLSQIVGYHNKSKFKEIESLLSLDLIQLFEGLLADFSEKDFKMAVMKAEGATLQAIGDAFGLTRERVRQIVKRVYNKLNTMMGSLVGSFIDKKGYVTTQELLDIYDNDDYDKVLIYWCKTSVNLEYLDFADIFIPAGETENFYEEQIWTLIEDVVGDSCDLNENMEALEELLQQNGFTYLDDKSILNILQKNNYRIHGNYALKGRQSYGYLCSKIVAKRFPNGIKLYDENDLNLLREYAKAEYGNLNIADDDRAFSSRLADFLILSGRGAATAIENIQVEVTLLEQIKAYIDDSAEGEFYYSHVFSEFEGLIRMMSNIDNHHFLHGVLMLYYPDDYEYYKDYLKKKGNNYISGKLSDRLARFITEKGRPIHRREIESKFPGITNMVILTAIYDSEELFAWDYNYYNVLNNINCEEQVIDDLRRIINEILSNNRGYCSEWMLYDAVKEEHGIFLESNNMKTAKNLYYYCAKLFEQQFDFRRPNITTKGKFEDLTVKDAALYLLDYPEELSFSEYMCLAERVQWSEVTVRACFTEIEPDYIKLTSDKYIKKTCFNIADNTIADIENCLEKFMSNGFISLINFDCWEELPEIGYEWNAHLLHSIIANYSNRYKIIQPRRTDRRYERGLIISKDSEVTDYVDLVISVLNDMNYNVIAENELLALLVVNGLAWKMIPQEMYITDKISYRDEQFKLL